MPPFITHLLQHHRLAVFAALRSIPLVNAYLLHRFRHRHRLYRSRGTELLTSKSLAQQRLLFQMRHTTARQTCLFLGQGEGGLRLETCKGGTEGVDGFEDTASTLNVPRDFGLDCEASTTGLEGDLGATGSSVSL